MFSDVLTLCKVLVALEGEEKRIEASTWNFNMLFKSKPRWGDNKHHTSTLEKGLAAQPVKRASATQHSNSVAGVDPREMKAEDPDTSFVHGRSQQRCSY